MLSDDIIMNIINFINILDLDNLKLVSRKCYSNIKYFLKLKIYIIRQYFSNIKNDKEFLFLKNCNDYYLFNLVAHLNNYNSLSLENIKINKEIFNHNNLGNYVIKIYKNISKISINYNNYNKKIELWYTNSYNNNLIGPALYRWYEDGRKECYIWYKNNYLHNDRGPASIRWYHNGTKEHESYYINGKHININKDKSKLIRWYRNGNKSFESYGNRENMNLPEIIRWYKNGYKQCELYNNYRNDRIKKWNEEGLLILDKFFYK